MKELFKKKTKEDHIKHATVVILNQLDNYDFNETEKQSVINRVNTTLEKEREKQIDDLVNANSIRL